MAFDYHSLKTVLPSYSWDLGVPTVDYQEFYTNPSDLLTFNEETSANEYVGYAPFFSVSLSSKSLDYLPEKIKNVKRTFDFGDFYNQVTNQSVQTSKNNIIVCHTYIMPGLYKVKYTEHHYEEIDINSPSEHGVYVQQAPFLGRYPFMWQWSNFLCNDPGNSKNTPITIEEFKFQNKHATTWEQAQGPCLSAYTKEILVVEEEKEIAIRVLEIPPRVYLHAENLPDLEQRFSPLTIRLTPKYIKSGSFPIEKIVWDLGDGSPLLVQRRWSPNIEYPFVSNNAFNLDTQDPRNYDVVHTYVRTEKNINSFYPSITAYASSTGTTDCAAIVVGPLKMTSTESLSAGFVVIENELNESGSSIISKIDDVAVVFTLSSFSR